MCMCVHVCVCVLKCEYVPVTSIVTSSVGGSPSFSASLLSHSVTQIRSTEADTLPRAQNFLFPFHPSNSLYVSTFSCQHSLPLCISLSCPFCLSFTLLHILINANVCPNSKQTQLHVVFHPHETSKYSGPVWPGKQPGPQPVLHVVQAKCCLFTTIHYITSPVSHM